MHNTLYKLQKYFTIQVFFSKIKHHYISIKTINNSIGIIL